MSFLNIFNVVVVFGWHGVVGVACGGVMGGVWGLGGCDGMVKVPMSIFFL